MEKRRQIRGPLGLGLSFKGHQWLGHGLRASPGMDPWALHGQHPGFRRWKQPLSIRVCVPKRIADGRAGGPGERLPQSQQGFRTRI